MLNDLFPSPKVLHEALLLSLSLSYTHTPHLLQATGPFAPITTDLRTLELSIILGGESHSAHFNSLLIYRLHEPLPG